MSAQTIEELAALAAQTDDQSETTTGGDFEYELPVEGVTIGRFVEYIELGKQKQKPYLGKPKPDAETVRLVFELLHPKKNIKEIELENGEKKTIADIISLTITKKLGEKARYKKLFNKMQYGRADKKHLAQMLGEAFIITIVHNKSDDGKKTYANIEKEGEFLIQAPFVIDPITEDKKPVPVPANIRPLKVFLFDYATKETWDSLYIDGTRTVKEEGKADKEQSKNWIQERIQGATNYQGSKINTILAGLSEAELPVTEEKKQGNASGEQGSNAQQTGTTTSPSKPDAEAALKELEASKGPATATTDDLASLGLS